MEEIRKKTTEELKKLLSEKREALKNFRFAITGSKIKNVKEGLSIRKEIARIMTVLRGRHL